ncbi:TPA: tail fiber assembly protein [Escherichia coli]|nr:tail fiber assembly protein [Escherichia coli]
MVEVDELPEGFGIEASWYYKDGEALPVPVDYSRLAEKKRQNLLNEAKDITSDWKTELELGTISDDDKVRLTQWMEYIKAVKALDLSTATDEISFDAINWPERPDAAA